MSSAVMLNLDDPTWPFHHMMAHRQYFAVMAPLNRFSVLPYLLEPEYDTDFRGSSWHLNHQRAHTDFTLSLPSNYNNPQEIGLPTSQPLQDSDLSNAESRSWWRFAQHQEHFLANQAILPVMTGTYPFW